MSIRWLLNKIMWDPKERSADYEVVFAHRGAPESRKAVPFRCVVRLGPSWLEYRDREGETLIPYHRVLEIRNVVTGEKIWSKQEENPGSRRIS